MSIRFTGKKMMLRLSVLAVLVMLASVGVWAQTMPLSGRVVFKKADGTSVPAVGAVVDVYRTDIFMEVHTTTDSAGIFKVAGMPFMGTYAISVSMPGARPAAQTDVKLNRDDVSI